MININEFKNKCAKLGIDIQKNNGQYKSWYDIFNELSGVWHKYNLNDYVKFYNESANVRIIEKATGKTYPEEYEWGKSEFWIDETTNILISRGLRIKDFGSISDVYIGNASEPYITIRFKNGIEIYAENQSPFWAIEENNKILSSF